MGFWEVSPSLDNIWECVSLDGSSWLATIWCFSDLCNLSRRGQIHSRQSKYQELYALTVWTYAKNCVELGHPNVMPYMRLFALSLHVLELHVFILLLMTDHHCASISTRGPLVLGMCATVLDTAGFSATPRWLGTATSGADAPWARSASDQTWISSPGTYVEKHVSIVTWPTGLHDLGVSPV